MKENTTMHYFTDSRFCIDNKAHNDIIGLSTKILHTSHTTIPIDTLEDMLFESSSIAAYQV